MIQETSFTIPKNEIETFAKKFNYVKNLKSIFLSTYLSFNIVSLDIHSVKIVVIETCAFELERSGDTADGTSLASVLLGLREVQSTGICFPNKLEIRFGEHGEANILHWAHSWLFGLVPLSFPALHDAVTDRFGIQLQGESVRDWIGFISLNNIVVLPEGATDTFTVDLRPSRKELLHLTTALTNSTFDPHMRSEVYKFVLESEDLHAGEFLNPCFLRRFSGLIFDECEISQELIAVQFHRRVVLENNFEKLSQFLDLIDPPLALVVHSYSDAIEQLFASIMACTLPTLKLLALWDALLVSSPELLVRVIAFALVDIRELVLSESAADAILTIGDLVHDFNSILGLARANDDICLLWRGFVQYAQTRN